MLASGPLPICASVRTAKPDGLIAQLAEAGCKMIALEAEAPIHLHRALTVIRAAGVRSAVSLSPATPLTRLEYLVAEADAVILDACEPGQTGGVHTQVLSERTRILKEFLRSETDAKEIIVTGAAAPFDAAHALAAGASTIVVGAAGLSKEGFDAFQSELTTRTRALESPA
jgi:ribulose-phosphate 3-epimerase